MSIQVQFRRGTAAQHANFTGAVGEMTVNTTNNTIHVHNGATLGGYETLLEDGSNLQSNSISLAAMAHQTQGEVFYYGASGAPSALAVGTSGQALRTNGAGANPSWGTLGGKEVWIPWVGGANEGNYSYYPTCSIQNDASAYFSFAVPSWYTGLSSASVYCIPQYTSGSANWDIYSVNSAVGQTYTTHTDSDTTTTYSTTANQIKTVDVSGILTTIAVNDYVGVRIQNRDGNGLYVVGLSLVYQ